MSLSHGTGSSWAPVSSPGGGEARLRGRWLPLARGACLAVAILALVVWGWGVPLRYAQLAAVCVAQPCGDQQLTLDSALRLQAAGISLGFYAAFLSAFEVAFMLVYVVVAAVIFWRKSETRIGVITVVFLVTYGATQTSADALASGVPAFVIPVNILTALSFVCLGLFLYLFPDGHFVPRWTRFAALAWVPLLTLGSGLLSSDIFVGLLFSFAIISLFAQIYRYRWVSTLPQRQQTKWVVFGVVTSLVGSIGIISTANLLGLSQVVGVDGLFVGNALIYLFGALIPLSIGAAILRSRLWDIDVLINKALVYGALSLLLAAVYAGLVIGLEHGLGAVEQGHVTQEPVVIVASTLAIAALFQPLRRRIQRVIDRRFYRHKYDAARTLDAFARTLREDLDLHDVTDRLLGAIEETMQPVQVSLWIPRTEDRTKDRTRAVDRP